MAQETRTAKAIFAGALDQQTPEGQSAYLDAACGGDQELRTKVDGLLRAYANAGDFLQTPPFVSKAAVDDAPFVEGPGTAIDRYKLLEKIGEGGMAVVYMAEQTEPVRRKVAFKIIKLGMDTKQVIARFEAERQALALMDHPNIAQVFDAGATETGRPYFVMELVTGMSITEYCNRNRLSTKDRLGLFIQVCRAVQHAHQKGIIHRDIKPSNVMVTMHDGRPVPKVIDFGIAKATNQKLTEKTLFTRYAHIIGTPAYMSPEQAELSDIDVDTRSDIYSLGVLLYELLTGTTPFGEEELRQVGYLEMQRVIREEEPTKPSTKLTALGKTLDDVARQRNATPEQLRKVVRGDLDWIVMKSLEKDRMRRYGTATQLLGDIERHLKHEPVSAGPPGVWYRTKKLLQRHGKLVAAGAAVMAAVVLGLIISITLYIRAERARAETATVTDFLANDLLASVYPERAKGQEVTVRYLLETASAKLETKFGDSPLAEAAVRTTLGVTYQKMGDNPAAQPHLERAWEIRRRQLGPEHPDTLTSLDQLGWLYWYQGRNEDARPRLVEAFEHRRRVLGPEHRDTLESMTHLAWLGEGPGSDMDDSSIAEHAYDLARRVLGEDDPITLGAAAALTMRQVANFQHAKAKAVAPAAYERSRRVLGDEHETTLVLMNVLTWLYGRQQRYEEAVPLGERAMEIARRVLGPTHMVTLHAQANLGWLYTEQGRSEEAMSLLMETLELARQHLGPDHVITVCCALKLGILYRAQGQYEQHDPLLIDLLRTCRAQFGEDSPVTGYAKYGLMVRKNQLTALAAEQEATNNGDAAAGTLARLEQICRALAVDSEDVTNCRD